MSKQIALNIREANYDDIDSIVELTKELGYQIKKEEVRRKLKKFELSLAEKIFVAELEDVVGWMHISLVEPLESEAFGEIRGIVVNQKYRKRGIGTELFRTAEKWTKEKDCKKLRIRTNIKREETRKYYNNLGLISKKTQEVFEKKV